MKLPEFKEINRKDFLFFSLMVFLSVALILVQVNIWTGDYSYWSLKDLKEEIKEKEKDKEKIRVTLSPATRCD